jgi:ABC-type molybdate transport system substrate-binding protein
MSKKTLRTLPLAEQLFFVLATLAFLLLPLLALAILSGQDASRITLTVYAAEPLRDALSALARDYEAEQPSIRLDLRFMSESEARRQAERGVPIDALILLEAYSVPERARHPEAAAQFVAFVKARLP